jgi:Resolvase, N terminal domain
VWKFDRFARSVSHLLHALETLKALGIGFVSFSEQMDTSTPAGKMVFTVLGAVAELERLLIVEWVRAGLRNAKAKGKRLGPSHWALTGSGSLVTWGFESGRSIGSSKRVPKFRKGLSAPVIYYPQPAILIRPVRTIDECSRSAIESAHRKGDQ